MKNSNIKKAIATVMCMTCVLTSSANVFGFKNSEATADLSCSSTVNAASITDSLEDMVNTATQIIQNLTAIETNSKYDMTSTQRYKDVTPHFINTGLRNAQNYNKIIDQFNVETNKRYKISGKSTWCNIYAWDVMRAMNVPFSHWVYKGTPLTFNEARKLKGVDECNVSKHLSWLNTYGTKYNWRKISASEAQKRANKGYPTLVLDSKGTHIAVVRPETSTWKYKSNNPIISQAGKYNVKYGYAKKYFGSDKTLVYWTHD